MDECESLNSETPELQESSYEALEALSQDDEDEVEELQNSLREVVQDPSVKPKVQCLMVDPSFSMVTVQSEDSGIVWETASSRCSTPWASETSSVSEGYSMEGSGAAGQITIIFDEEKVVRRRTRSGRSSRLSDRFSRPGSSRSASALGVERPEMMEVSQPNIKQEKMETEPDLEEIKDIDQQLFSLISEGYEILNIRVPSKLPTVDEEESTELQDNLSYLDQTSKIKSRKNHQWTQAQSQVLSDVEAPTEESKQATDSDLKSAQTEGPGDIDYFEKFTLLDVVVPDEQAAEQQDESIKPLKQQEPEQTAAKDTAKDISPSVSEESFVFVSDEDIVGEHLDEVFYGEGAPADSQQRSEDEAEGGRMRRQSSIKESGSVLFASEETVLTPIYISPGPPKIIDQILLEEPTAMSFMYSDLYEDAMGERRRSDEEYSEAESVTSEKSFKRCFSDFEEADDGYLEKFTLKDEIPTVDIQSDVPDNREEGRMMWSENKFEMTGCLIRLAEEDVDDTKKAVEEAGTTQTDLGSQSALLEAEKEYVKEEEQKVQPCEVTGETVEEESKVTEKIETQKDQSEILEIITDQVEQAEKDKLESVSEQSDTEKQQPSEKVESADEVIEATTHMRTASSEIPKSIRKTGVQEEVSEMSESTVHAFIVDTEPETHGEAQTEAPFEVSTDCEPPVHVHVEVVDKSTNETEIQTQVRIHLQEETELHMLEEEQITTANESKATLTDVMLKDLGQATDVLIQEDAERDSGEKQTEIVEPHQEVTCADLEKVEDKLEAAPEIVTGVVKEMVSVGDEFILLVPKGQAVQMDIEISPQPEKRHTVREQVDNQFEPIAVDENTTAHTETVPKPDSVIHPQLKEKSEVVVKEEAQDRVILKTALMEESHEVEQKMGLKEEEEVASSVPSCAPQHDLPVIVMESDSEIQAKPQFEENAEVVIKEDVQDREVLTLAPGEESHKVEQKMDLEEDEVMSSVPSCTPQQDLSSSPREADFEEADYEIITKQEAKESSEFEILQQEEPQPESAQETEPISKELMEESFEYKTIAEEEDEVVLSTLKRFTPLEDLSGFHEGAADLEILALEEPPEIDIIKDDQGVYLHEEVAQKEKDEIVSPEVTAEELEYEMISKQDTAEMPEVETEVDKVQSESVKETEESTKDLDQYIDDKALELTTDTELIEADYETIDAEEERQARLAAELQGMDWYCLTCGCLLLEEEWSTGEHQSHEVTAVDRAYEEIMEKLSDWISELQGRSENIEDLVSELELAYNSVEDQFHESEVAMQAQNEEMMALVMEQYNSMSFSMEEEKKAKLEQLYDQIVSFQESIDSAKSTLETTARESETDARSPEDIHARLKVALDSAMSLELGPRGLLVFEDYAKGNTSSSHLAQRKGIPVPQRPTLQPQEPGSATSTSVTVYWKVNPGDVIDCFQVYCMEDPQGAISDEYRVTVKESYCVLEELEPDKTYKVWVMAVNYTGCSLPSERLTFRTAPSVPVIDTEGCTVIWNMAILRWSSIKQTPGQSYTLEYCRQYELEGEGLRSISGIKNFEQKVLLQPNENYLFYIKAVNEAGSSEQSEAALISTKGTRFHLLKASAHPALELSVDQTTLHYSQDTHENMTTTEKTCPSILGELLPVRGHYYWETNVSTSTAYRVGVAYSSTNRDSPLGEDGTSWCLQCIPTPTGCSYQLVHNDVHSSLFVIDIPERVGIFLDYKSSRLSFYNAQSGQSLGSFSQCFTQPCHPAVGMDAPGSLEVCMVQEVPEFTKDS